MTDVLNELPVKYAHLTPSERRVVRLRYVEKQDGSCWHCKSALSGAPPNSITQKTINWSCFPANFLRHPVHLHHDHKTGLTIGAVHAYCNAVLWQYHGQ